MKQGTVITRIMIVLMFFMVCAYLLFSVLRSLDDRTYTVTTYAHTVDDAVEATGLLIRAETVVTGQTAAIVDVLPDQGEKVRAGAAVAYLYQDESALDRRRELRTLTLEQEQLKYALQGQDGTDASRLDQSIVDAMVGLRTSAAYGDLTSLEEQSLSFKSLVIRHGYASDAGVDELSAAITALDAQIQALQSASALDTTTVYAPCAGTFSAMADGYESTLYPDMLETLTAASFKQLMAPDPTAPAGAVGKLITDSKWYLATTVSPEVAERLVVGRSVTVRFSRDWSGEVSMKIERVDKAADGACLVILSSTRNLADTSMLRKQTVDIVFNSLDGIRVPKKAVRTENREVTDPETGETTTKQVIGVYVLTAAQAEFKAVEILADDGDYYLVQAVLPDVPTDNQLKTAFRAGDQVIVSSDELYDGKVMTK
ncbi:HlyD family efflux transporter periplasmic adaptor subunit [Intestinimonas timonensis]|uniref:HlyD family efflux transporter periplasmic adaptor subunit n=1 Tax=Intestinimonas timonensis TaxID=1689270 RepID=UPI00102FE424|nr:HlyD family efflux transporter periplasmic adaptor subunit [Intestinimonas timonensis]